MRPRPTRYVRHLWRARGRSVAADAAAATHFTGETFGTQPGETPGGTLDTFAPKHDFRGREVWTRQFGRPAGKNAPRIVGPRDACSSLAASRGLSSDRPRPAALMPSCPGSAGAQHWTRQFGRNSCCWPDLPPLKALIATGLWRADHHQSRDAFGATRRCRSRTRRLDRRRRPGGHGP